jgi:4-amino-4-deoxy-L-arabinose transferase-like glycosyltransferase
MPVARSIRRLGIRPYEVAGLIPILLVAAADRFVNLPARGIWDTDQGVETGAVWNAVVNRDLPVYGSPAYTTGSTFHHGALFYDLMMPFAWLGGGNPVLILAAIALFGFLVVPLLWWTARSMGGPSAGLATAAIAAVSPALVDYSTFIWNPVLMEIGVALACLGAWQAWTSSQPRWWALAALGTAVASQSHLTGFVLTVPMALFFLAALRRGPASARNRILKWGLIGIGIFVLTWSPLIISEFQRNFPEVRAMLTFRQPGPPGSDPLTRLFVTTIRILAYPLTLWPLTNLTTGIPAALTVTGLMLAGMIWRVTGALSPRAVTGTPLEPSVVEAAGQRATRERDGLAFVGGSLLLIVLILAFGLKEASQIRNVTQEQYHVVADVFVVLALGLVVGGLWRARPLRGRAWSGHLFALLLLAPLLGLGIVDQPPLTSPDGGWAAADAAATRIEARAAGSTIGLVNLPSFKQADAYGYPLALGGASLVSPADATTVVVLCDAGWYPGCGGQAEELWRLGTANGASLTLVERFEAAPQRMMSIYRRAP